MFSVYDLYCTSLSLSFVMMFYCYLWWWNNIFSLFICFLKTSCDV